MSQKTTFGVNQPLGYRVRLTGLGLKGGSEIVAGEEAFDTATMDNLAFYLWRLPRGVLIHVICDDTIELLRFGTGPTLLELIDNKGPSVKDMILRPDPTALTHVALEGFGGYSLLVVSPIIAHIGHAGATLSGIALTSGGRISIVDSAD